MQLRGLPEFGLPLTAAESGDAPSQATILTNNTGQAIVAISTLALVDGPNGEPCTARSSNLGSSVVLDALNGRTQRSGTRGTFIFPGETRMLTARGAVPVVGPGFGGGTGGGQTDERRVIELSLDLVILEDGQCLGPNESGLFETINDALDQQCATAAECLAALQSGAGPGAVFEILLPLARTRQTNLLVMFAQEAIHSLIQDEALSFFQSAAAPRALPLRRVK